jgi:hypothetical protein
LARAQGSLEEDEAEPLFLIAARGARALDYQQMEMQKDASEKVLIGKPWIEAARSVWNKRLTFHQAIETLPGSLPGKHAPFLRHMNQVVEIAKRPVEEWQPLLDAMSAGAKGSPTAIRGDGGGGQFCASHAEMRCAIVAVAAERFRHRHGRWPTTPAELVPAQLLKTVPADPYDGQPIKFARTADGLTVYCIGPDGADNGGIACRRDYSRPGCDIGFRLWDPTARRQSPSP